MDKQLNYGEVSNDEFNAIMERSIKLKECVKCGNGGGEILVKMPFYGRTGAVVMCPHCKAYTKIQGISVMMFSGKLIGTPVTEESLMHAIKKAVRLWNSGEVTQ